jgi:hypothetical protein
MLYIHNFTKETRVTAVQGAISRKSQRKDALFTKQNGSQTYWTDIVYMPFLLDISQYFHTSNITLLPFK